MAEPLWTAPFTGLRLHPRVFRKRDGRAPREFPAAARRTQLTD
ncbi:hypothetical protein [Streptomyces collinus]